MPHSLYYFLHTCNVRLVVIEEINLENLTAAVQSLKLKPFLNCDKIARIRYISSLSFCFFWLVQAWKCLEKPESDKQEKLSVYFEKAGCRGPQKKQE